MGIITVTEEVFTHQLLFYRWERGYANTFIIEEILREE